VSNQPELEPYWQEAASWDADRITGFRRRERLAWGSALGGWSCAVICAVALVLLVPLKQIAPFLVRVDSTTGLVDVVPVAAPVMSMPELVTRYLLTHYVMVCERFNFATAESDYEECGAFHSAARNQAWYAQWNPASPDSPLNRYRDGSTVRASVISVSFFKRANGMRDLAQVRYVKRVRHAGATEEQVSHWVVTVQYSYVAPSRELRLRSLNPLGFRIEDFRPEPEVPVEGASANGTDAHGAREEAR